MANITRFEDIVAWQKARANDKEVFKLTSNILSQRDYALADQMRRSSGSIMDNIAEGFERGGNKEFIQFLYISKGSSGELKSQLYRALDRGYLTNSDFEPLYSSTSEISKLITGFINYLKGSKIKGDKYYTKL